MGDGSSPRPDEAVDALRLEITDLRAENDRLRGLLGTRDEAVATWERTLFVEAEVDDSDTPVDQNSLREAKVAFFRSLFVGRNDVHVLRWENPRSGKAGWSPAVRGDWANARRPDREYLPLTEGGCGSHLSGGTRVGLYPLLKGDACRLLVCDFDGAGGCWTPSLSLTRRGPPAYQLASSARGQEMRPMFRRSSRARFQPHEPGGSAFTYCGRR